MYSRSSRVSSSLRPPTIARWAWGWSGAIFSKASTRETCALRGSTVPTQTTSSASSGIPAARRASARSNSARAASIGRDVEPVGDRQQVALRGEGLEQLAGRVGLEDQRRCVTERGLGAKAHPGVEVLPDQRRGEALVDRPQRRDPEPLRDLDPGEGR